MSINFIIPNQLRVNMEKGLRSMGFTGIDYQRLEEEMNPLFNKPQQRRLVEQRYGRIIPKDLPVCVSSNKEADALLGKYGVSHQSPDVSAAVALGIDTTHQMVLVLIEEHLNNPAALQHELVHYHQIKDGHLVYNADSTISWTKPNEEFTIDCTKDMLIRNKLCDTNDFLYHELQKPWELEAYSVTTPRWIRKTFSDKNQRLMEQYLLTH